MLLNSLDILFTVFHTGLICFNLLGWVWGRTRIANLVTLLLTTASWFVLGIFFGLGYCPLTDWHWQVKSALGQSELPNSYLKWLLDSILGTDMSPAVADGLALGGLVAALMASISLNCRDWLRKQQKNKASE